MTSIAHWFKHHYDLTVKDNIYGMYITFLFKKFYIFLSVKYCESLRQSKVVENFECSVSTVTVGCIVRVPLSFTKHARTTNL